LGGFEFFLSAREDDLISSMGEIVRVICRSTVSVRGDKVETPIHGSIRELVTWECKEHGVKS
jgi:hypothetical protein